MADTKIEWTDSVWNPVRGCSMVSRGCERCYAMKQAHRFSGRGAPYEGLTELGPNGPRWAGKIRLVPELLDRPLHWKKPRRIFVNSMSDLFHEDVPEDFIFQCYQQMGAAFWHTYQILTKRPQRALEILPRISERLHAEGRTRLEYWKHVWLGVSCEDQKTADERLMILRDIPNAMPWVSYEPALAGVDFSVHLDFLRWIVCGGESGPSARPFNIQWARDVIQQCRSTGTKVFFKQAGSNAVLDNKRIRLMDRKGGDWSEWPELKVREYPR